MPPKYPHDDTCPCHRCAYLREASKSLERLRSMIPANIGRPQTPVFVIFDRAFAEPTPEELQQALAEALAQEEYELAAELRDKLLEIQKVV
jgi:aspartate/methionine/tyrosine aminotransferase